jgi:DNA adenine methylase
VVVAAYRAAADHLGEWVRPLESHTAADERTGALGDVEITLADDHQVITAYEMKLKRITRDDIDRALYKVNKAETRIDNYIFITTEEIDERVVNYAASLYRETGGIEFVILDCIGFIRHFLHLFHRLRVVFLDTYQELLLQEPGSAVRESLKEAFLAMRRAAESSYTEE